MLPVVDASMEWEYCKVLTQCSRCPIPALVPRDLPLPPLFPHELVLILLWKRWASPSLEMGSAG